MKDKEKDKPFFSPARFRGGVPDLLRDLGREASRSRRLPNASVIYGVGAGFLLAFALYSLFTGAWFTALILLIPAGALIGFALHYLSYDQ